MPVFKCKHPTCDAMLGDRGYCPVHQPDEQQAEKDRQLAYDLTRRDPEMAAFYRSRRWIATRDIYRADHPICEMCHQATTDVIHHKTPAKRLPPHERCNQEHLEAACNACHSRHEWNLAHGINAYRFEDTDWDGLKAS